MVEQIGRYRVLSAIGEGGFGKVYLAEDPALAGRRVAIKVLTAAHDQNLRLRFKNEAVAAANLRHPNIVTILEYGEEQEKPYIVMEYLEGQDLAKRLAGGPPLTLYQKVHILQQIGSGLHAAHSHPKAIVHRDVKPANIMLLPDGHVKIMDFGIARLADSGARLTSANILMGSVSYMAPEQFISGAADAQCDIWSFGVLAYELLTEQHPFAAGDVTQVMYKVTSVNVPPVDRVLPGCPKELGAVVAKAMCRSREQRYRTLEDAVFDLGSLAASLRHSEAGQVLKKAERLYSSGQLESALQVVRDALEIDSQLANARVLREKLQAEIQLRANRAQVEALLRKVTEALEHGDLRGAIGTLEQACRLDPSDALLARRLSELRKSQDQREQAEESVRAGRRFLETGELNAAQRALERAMKLDAAAPGIAALRGSLEGAQALERRVQDVARILRESDAAYMAGQFDAALQGLEQGLGKYPGETALQQRLAHYKELVEQSRAEAKRGVWTIQSHLSLGQIAEAKAVCVDALRRFPYHQELRNQWTEIAQAEEAARQAAEQARVAAEQARIAAEQARAAAEQQQEIDRLLIEIRGALGSGQLDEAARVANLAVSRHPGNAEFRRLAAQAQEALARRAEHRTKTLTAVPPVPPPRTKPVEPKSGVFPPETKSQTWKYALAFVGTFSVFGGVGWYFLSQNNSVPPEPLRIAIGNVAKATVGTPYLHQVAASGGQAPLSWRAEGDLPPGLSIDGSGAVSGTPVAAGDFRFRIEARDAAGRVAAQEILVTVSAPEVIPDTKTGTSNETTKGGTKQTKSGPGPASKQDAGKADVRAEPVEPAKVEPAKVEPVKVEPSEPIQTSADTKSKAVTPASPAIRREDYFGPLSGTLSWSGQLNAGGAVSVEGNRASVGNLGGSGLPRVEGVEIIEVSPPGVRLIEVPSEQNGWRRLVLEANEGGISNVTIRWRVRR
jgi:serine/threonine-protein kinase